jgi:hypothetical protein
LPFLTITIINACFEKWSVSEFFKLITGYYFFTQDINFYLWFVYAIVILYLLFPLYYKFFKAAENKVLFTSGAIMIWLFITLILRDRIRFDIFGFTNRIPVFLVGILFGYITQNRKDIVFTVKTYIFLLITFALSLYLEYLSRFLNYDMLVPQGKCFLPNFLLSVSFPFLFAKLLDICKHHLAWPGKAINAVYAFFGTITIEMYCMQDFFPVIIPHMIKDGWNYLLINLTIFFLVIASAWVESVLFREILSLADKCFEAKKQADPE